MKIMRVYVKEKREDQSPQTSGECSIYRVHFELFCFCVL